MVWCKPTKRSALIKYKNIINMPKYNYEMKSRQIEQTRNLMKKQQIKYYIYIIHRYKQKCRWKKQRKGQKLQFSIVRVVTHIVGALITMSQNISKHIYSVILLLFQQLTLLRNNLRISLLLVIKCLSISFLSKLEKINIMILKIINMFSFQLLGLSKFAGMGS